MRALRSLLLIVNFQTLGVVALAVGATVASQRLGLRADFPLTLIATAIVFPVVFSIGGAYKRRENALGHYGSMKSHGRAIYFAARDWIEESDPLLCKQTKEDLLALFVSCRELFGTPREGMAEPEERVYRAFSRLSLRIRSFRQAGLAGGECSRCNQYLSKMMLAFEGIKHIYQYRTPRTLRTYSKLAIFALPVVYGPYFAALATEYSPQLAYVMPVLFSAIIVALDNIQDHLENPFDQVGEDDVIINAEKFVARLDL